MAAEPELLIRFKGDTKDLESQIEKLKSSLAGIEPATSKAEKGNKKLEDSNKNLGNSFANLAKGYLTFQAALSAGRFILDSTLQVGKFETQLKTASGSQEKFGQNMAFLEDLANTYKKNVVDLGASFAQLTIATKGTNLEGAETEKLFKAVTIASAALKMSTDDTNGTFRAFIQMVSKGNVQAEELRGQLGERLYGAFNLAAKAMGKTTAELNKMLENGEVLASDLLPKLSNLILDTFSADAVNGAKALGSNIEYATGQVTLFVAELAKTSGAESTLNGMVSSFGELVKELRNVNKEFGLFSTIGYTATSAVTGYVNTLISGIEKLTNLIPGVTQVGGVDLGRVDNPLSKLGQGQKPQKYPFLGSGSASGVGSNIVSGLSGVIPDQVKAEAKIYEAATVQLTEKQKQALEKAQRERDRVATYLASEEKKNAAVRLQEQLQSLESETEKAYAKYNGIIQNVIGKSGKTGLSNLYDSNTFDKIGEEFTNGVSGGGDIEKKWDDLTDASKNGMSKFIQSVKDGSIEYKAATKEFTEDDNIENLMNNINSILRDGVTQMAVSFAEMAGSALAGGEGFENAGKKFGLMVASLLSDLGKALIAYSTLKIAFDISKMNPYAALAIGVATVVAGSALKEKFSEGEKGFYTGGIVTGPAGLDAVPARLTRGEMVLNKSQQSRMFGMLDGTNTGNRYSNNFGSDSRNSEISGILVGRLKGADIDIAGKLGKKQNNKFS